MISLPLSATRTWWLLQDRSENRAETPTSITSSTKDDCSLSRSLRPSFCVAQEETCCTCEMWRMWNSEHSVTASLHAWTDSPAWRLSSTRHPVPTPLRSMPLSTSCTNNSSEPCLQDWSSPSYRPATISFTLLYIMSLRRSSSPSSWSYWSYISSCKTSRLPLYRLSRSSSHYSARLRWLRSQGSP